MSRPRSRNNRLATDEPVLDRLELIGPFKAEVVDNKDPEKEGKITVKIPEMGKEDIKFVEPKYPGYEQYLPQVGMWTWVTFRHLNINLPMWEGSWFPDSGKVEGWNGEPDQHVKRITDQNNETVFTLHEADEKGKKLTIRDHIRGNIIEFDGNTGNIDLYSDHPREGGQKQGHISLNGEDGHYGSVRQFHATKHICILSGLLVEGVVTEGSKRVVISND